MTIMTVRQLTGVGPRLEQQLARLGIHTIVDLLLHVPHRYEDRTQVTAIGQLVPQQTAVVEGEITAVTLNTGPKPSLRCEFSDDSGSMQLYFFHYIKSLQQRYYAGLRLRCYGDVRLNRNGLVMMHPDCQRLVADQPMPLPDCLTAVYPTIKGISQITWRKLQAQALQRMHQGEVAELLPAHLLHDYHLMSMTDALSQLHRPKPQSLGLNEQARKRLCVEELLAHHLALRHFRQDAKQQAAVALLPDEVITQQFLQQLPFALTKAQQKVSQEIRHDLQQTQAMSRLVQGDVGSGKTVVAMLAMLQAVANAYQAVMMAPTELLAEQHYQTISLWLEGMPFKAIWLAGSLTASVKKARIAEIASGEVDIIIGTHAVFQQQVTFKRLALVIVDEQHRFGVQQRLRLRHKGQDADRIPHQLVMSATPIPRTLAMMYYADLDCSIIDELPQGRKPIQTIAMPESRRADVIDRIKQFCQQGRQVYWVCCLIEESEAINAQAAADTLVILQRVLPQLRLQLIHGRLKAQEKESIMAAFKQGEIDLLVATTVIEVGVDVPNANLMVIENAERLGLAQLHQLRGRVGRGQADSYCVLLYKAPLSHYARERINTLRQTQDGFVVAECDLRLRGEGEILGKRQTGLANFRIADLQRDQALLPLVERLRQQLQQQSPSLVLPLIKRWFAHYEAFVTV